MSLSMVTLLSEGMSLTKTNRGFSFLTEKYHTLSECFSVLLKAAVPNGSNLEGVLFIWGTDQWQSAKLVSKKMRAPYLGGI